MRWLAIVFAVLSACDDFEPRPQPQDSGITAQPRCRDGLHEAVDASVVVSRLLVTEQVLSADFDPMGRYDGAAAACISDDGRTMILLFEVGGQAFGRLIIEHPGPGSYEVNEGAASLTVELFGAAVPTTYVAGDWQTSSWSVDVQEGTVISDFFGTAYSGTESLSLTFQLAVTP